MKSHDSAICNFESELRKTISLPVSNVWHFKNNAIVQMVDRKDVIPTVRLLQSDHFQTIVQSTVKPVYTDYVSPNHEQLAAGVVLDFFAMPLVFLGEAECPRRASGRPPPCLDLCGFWQGERIVQVEFPGSTQLVKASRRHGI